MSFWSSPSDSGPANRRPRRSKPPKPLVVRDRRLARPDRQHDAQADRDDDADADPGRRDVCEPARSPKREHHTDHEYDVPDEVHVDEPHDALPRASAEEQSATTVPG